MYLVDIKKLYFYGVSFVSLLALCFSLLGGLSNLARYYWFETGPLVSYQPPFISTWVPWNSLMTNSYVNPGDPYTIRMEEESLEEATVFNNYSDLDPSIKEAINSWVDSYTSWKNEQVNLRKSVLDNIITNLSAFVIFFLYFYFI
uniref:Uncharacterized protein n=1 Tax=candidate division WWE3 bacterium TaxID=2053526 RepID=A0A7C4TQ63_UNCKA